MIELAPMWCLTAAVLEGRNIDSDKFATINNCTLLVLIDFCPVQRELFTWNSVTKTFAILPENIIEYQIQA